MLKKVLMLSFPSLALAGGLFLGGTDPVLAAPAMSALPRSSEPASPAGAGFYVGPMVATVVTIGPQTCMISPHFFVATLTDGQEKVAGAPGTALDL